MPDPLHFIVYKEVGHEPFHHLVACSNDMASSAPATLSRGAENCSTTGGIPDCDWAGLEHYRIANNKAAAPLKAERRVVFFGDSITELWNLVEYFAGMPYINRGIRSQITSQMLVYFGPM